MEAAGRRAAGDRGTDIDEVPVAVGARAEHRVGEHDGVRLCPGDLGAWCGAMLALIGRTGPGRSAAHRQVSLHQLSRARFELLRSLMGARVHEIERTDVERRRHRHPRLVVTQPSRELEPRVAMVEAAVDMRRLDVEKLLGAVDLGHRAEDAHRHPRRLSSLAGEHPAIVVTQRQGHLEARGRILVERPAHFLCTRRRNRLLESTATPAVLAVHRARRSGARPDRRA